MTIREKVTRLLSLHLGKETAYDHRAWFVLIAVIYIVVLLMIGGHYFGDYAHMWYAFGVPSSAPSFFDLRLITSAFDCSQKGMDVLYSNPCDQWNRAFNYPRILLSLASSGIGEKHTELIGVIIAFVFFLASTLFIGRVNPAQTAVYCCVYCSAGVMLGIGTGNADVVVFIMLCLFMLLDRHWRDRLSGTVAKGILLSASLVKLFPIVSIVYYLRETPRRFMQITGCLAGSFLAYSLWYWKDLVRVYELTPRNHIISYGAFVYFDGLAWGLGQAGMQLNTRIGHIVIIGIAAALIVRYLVRWLRSVPVQVNMNHIDSFRVGASIYVGTFLLGNNWDYRLIFLIFTLPQMMEWGKRTDPFGAKACLIMLIVIVRFWGEYWVNVLPFLPLSHAVKHALEWTLFAYYANALIVTLPLWTRGRNPQGAQERVEHATG